MRTLARILLYVVLPGTLTGMLLAFVLLESLSVDRVLTALVGAEAAGAILAHFNDTLDPSAIAIAAILIIVGLVLLAIDLLRHRPTALHRPDRARGRRLSRRPS